MVIEKGQTSKDISEEEYKHCAIYEQDGEMYRYVDKLKWNRFQTAAAIEAGVLYTISQNSQKTSLNGIEQLAFMFFGFLLVAIVCTASIRDEHNCTGHLNRMKAFEGINPFTRSNGISASGKGLMRAGIYLILTFNLILLIYWCFKLGVITLHMPSMY